LRSEVEANEPHHDGGGHDQPEHGGGHHQEFNWLHGFIGAKEGVEPGLLWRPVGMPPPFGATLLNTVLLVVLVVKLGAKPIRQAITSRRERLLRGMDEAAAMRKESEEQLALYRSKLDNLDAEIERVRREMRDSAEAERRRVLEEAAVRRERLEREARVLVEQELKATKQELIRSTALAALRSARELLATATSTEDHRRLSEDHLQSFAPRPSGGREEPSP
jgi:F0F1-type ATP synthase membrane subunit b/b'